MIRKVFYITCLFFTMTVHISAAAPPIETRPFWQSTEIDTYSSGMVWRDCNLDGHIDVFFSNGNDIVQAANMIYLSDRGWLPAQANWYSGNYEYSGHCAVGDIDDDGFPDFVVSNYIGNSFANPNRSDFYYNQGFLPSTMPDWYTPDSIYSFSCALGDVDNDGDLDLAFATGEGYTSVFTRDLVYLNEGGAFSSTAYWQSDLETAALDVAWGDVDNDGDLDLAFTYDEPGTAVYYNESGVLEGTPSWVAGTNEPGNTLIFGDVNGDGWLDLVVAYNNQLGGGGRFRVYFNDGAGNLDPDYGWQSNSSGYGSALAMYDYDNDGDDDLAAGRWFSRLMIYENLGTTFTAAPVWYSIDQMVAEEIAWVDIDGRGVAYFADTIPAESGKRLFYVEHSPLYAIDSVVVDGSILDHPDFCYDLFYGWVSLAQAPTQQVVVHYRYSFTNDLTIANWGMVNFAFANTNSPQIDFYADTSFGWAPLTIQFSDSSTGASEWLWRFGDGDSSTLQHPSHTYVEGGTFDVELEVTLPDGRFNRIQHDMIMALGDTLFFGSVVTGPPGTVEIPVVLKNTPSLRTLEIPVSYAGDLTLNYQGWNTDGCRTDYFEDIQLIAADPSHKKIVLVLSPGEYRPPLPEGRGPVINLQFYQYGTGVTTFDTTTLSGHDLDIEAVSFSYQPRVVAGHIYHGMCGNVDGDPTGMVDLGDLTALIDYLFISLTPPVIPEQANVDGSINGVVDLGDLTYMIAYLFLDGPPPVCP